MLCGMQALALMPEALERLAAPSTHRLDEAVTFLRRLRGLVEGRWAELSDEERDALRAVVDTALDPRGSGWRVRLVGAAVTVWLALFRREQLYEYAAEIKLLVDAIMEADEGSSERHRRAVAEALESPVIGGPMTAEAFREWLKRDTGSS